MKYLLRHAPWLLLLLAVDAFAALLLWLADVRAFSSMITVILLFTVLLFGAVCCVLARSERKKEEAFLDFLYHADEYHEEMLLKAAGPFRKESVLSLAASLRGKQAAYTGLKEQWEDYEEYVETWAHETKIPLSLLTLLLDNHREELPAALVVKLDYVRNRTWESIDQMLFYARLKSPVKDYLFEYVNLRSCIGELLEDYGPLLEEKDFRIRLSLSGDMVYSDRRGLRFLLGQLISNAVKYCGREPELCFLSSWDEGRCLLHVRDNGMGVRSCDLPYIFEKGFTGDSGENKKKATGMGLYLAKEMAKDLNLTLHASSRWGEGFEMQIAFPVVEER